jgi:hypothetical protein
VTVTVNRTRQTLRANWPFEVVLIVVVAGFVIALSSPSHWLRAVVVVGAALLLAGVLRAVLPSAQAGLLCVRSRIFDIVCYLGLGALVISFGALVPR